MSRLALHLKRRNFKKNVKTEPNQTRKEFDEGPRYHPHNGVLKARREFKRLV